MNEELEVLKIVAKTLQTAAIPYMVRGSIAANFYSVPRMTRDIDVVIQLKPVDAIRFTRLFEKDFYTEGAAVSDAIA